MFEIKGRFIYSIDGNMTRLGWLDDGTWYIVDNGKYTTAFDWSCVEYDCLEEIGKAVELGKNVEIISAGVFDNLSDLWDYGHFEDMSQETALKVMQILWKAISFQRGIMHD